MTPETKVKNHLKKRLLEVCETAKLPIRISSRDNVYGTGGMPDNDICINGCLYVFIEAKAEDKDVVPEGRQDLTIREMRATGETVYVLIGCDGVDRWFETEFDDIPRLRGLDHEAWVPALVAANHAGIQSQKARARARAISRKRPAPPKRKATRRQRDVRRQAHAEDREDLDEGWPEPAGDH